MKILKQAGVSNDGGLQGRKDQAFIMAVARRSKRRTMLASSDSHPNATEKHLETVLVRGYVDDVGLWAGL